MKNNSKRVIEPGYRNMVEQQWRRDNAVYLAKCERSKWASLIWLISMIVGIIMLLQQ